MFTIASGSCSAPPNPQSQKSLKCFDVVENMPESFDEVYNRSKSNPISIFTTFTQLLCSILQGLNVTAKWQTLKADINAIQFSIDLGIRLWSFGKADKTKTYRDLVSWALASDLLNERLYYTGEVSNNSNLTSMHKILIIVPILITQTSLNFNN